MGLPKIFVNLVQLGYQPEFLGDASDKYATIKLDGYYIENRIVYSGFRITGNDTFISVFDGKDVLKFFKQKLEEE